jgi:N-methylhydantoinase B/oxoprolinase/acetone carboxylase alpha subunit
MGRPETSGPAINLYPDEAYAQRSGGGGWGNPNRDVKRVQMMSGWARFTEKLEMYMVVLHPDTFDVEYEAIEKLRKEMEAKTDLSREDFVSLIMIRN